MYGTDYTIWADQLDRALLIHARRDRKIECHCSKPLTFVDSTIRIPHFRHLTGSCSIIGAERDTETHNEGLEYVGQILRSNLKHAHVEKEAIFKVPGGKRRTDIFVELEGGNSICYELRLLRKLEEIRSLKSPEAKQEYELEKKKVKDMVESGKNSIANPRKVQ